MTKKNLLYEIESLLYERNKLLKEKDIVLSEIQSQRQWKNVVKREIEISSEEKDRIIWEIFWLKHDVISKRNIFKLLSENECVTIERLTKEISILEWKKSQLLTFENKLKEVSEQITNLRREKIKIDSEINDKLQDFIKQKTELYNKEQSLNKLKTKIEEERLKLKIQTDWLRKYDIKLKRYEERIYKLYDKLWKSIPLKLNS